MTEEFIQENSLYADATSRAALVSNPSKALDAFFLNYLGFLGLYAFSDSRGFMRTYETTEKELEIDKIDDGNHDVSLSIKVIRDAGVIDNSKVRALTKLLALIKTKKVRSKDIDEVKIREMIAATMLGTKTCSAQVKSIVHDFLGAKMTLKAFAMAAYDLAKKPEFRDVTLELRNLVLKGQYGDFFTLARKAAATPPTVVSPVVTPAAVVPAVTAPAGPVLKADVKARIQSYLDNVRSSSKDLKNITEAIGAMLNDSTYINPFGGDLTPAGDELAAAYITDIDPKYFEVEDGAGLFGSIDVTKPSITRNTLFIKYFEAMVRTATWDRFTWRHNMPNGYDFYTPLLKAVKESVPPTSSAACTAFNTLTYKLRQVAGQNNANYAIELAPLLNIKDKAHKAHLMGIIPPITHTSVWNIKAADVGAAAATWIKTWGAKMNPYTIILEGAKLPNSEVAKMSPMDQLKLALTEYEGDMAGFGVRFPNVSGRAMFGMFDDDSIDIYTNNPDLCEKGFGVIKNEPISGNGRDVLTAMKKACALTMLNRMMSGESEVKDYWSGGLNTELFNIEWRRIFPKTRERVMAWLVAMPVADSADYHKFEAAFNLLHRKGVGPVDEETLFKFDKTTVPNAQGGVNNHNMQWLPIYADGLYAHLPHYGDSTFVLSVTGQSCVINVDKLGTAAKDWLTKRGTSIGQFEITKVAMVTDPEVAKDIYLKSFFDADTSEEATAVIETSVLADIRRSNSDSFIESFNRLCKPGKTPGMFKKWPSSYSGSGDQARVAAATYVMNYLNDVQRAKSLLKVLIPRASQILHYAKFDVANLTTYTVFMLSYMIGAARDDVSGHQISQYAQILDAVIANPSLAAEIESDKDKKAFYSDTIGIMNYESSMDLMELMGLHSKAIAANNKEATVAIRKIFLRRRLLPQWVCKSTENAAKYREMTGYQTDEVVDWLKKTPMPISLLIRNEPVVNNTRFGASPERVADEGSECWIIPSAFLDTLDNDTVADVLKTCAEYSKAEKDDVESDTICYRLAAVIDDSNTPFGDGQGRSKTESAVAKWAIADQIKQLKTTNTSPYRLANRIIVGEKFGVIDDETIDELTASHFQDMIDNKYQIANFTTSLNQLLGKGVKIRERTMQTLVTKFVSSESELAQDALIGLGFSDNGALDPEFVKAVRAAKKETIVARRISKACGVHDVLQQMKNDPNGVKIDIAANRLAEFLRHNDIDLSGHISTKAIKTFEDMEAQRKANAENFVVPPLQLEEIKDPKVAVDRTAALFKANQFNHNPALGLNVMRVFKPTLKGNVERFDAWVAANPDTTFMDLYHGTGTINAAFILRFGFKIIKSTDPSVTGRMLGDGIYFADNINKSMLYMSNAGYIRQSNQEGYVIKCRVALGKKPANYRDGSSQSSTLVSNEWAVFSTDQIRIDEVYYGVSLEKRRLESIMLTEASDEYSPNVSEFMFMDGQIPVSDDVLIDFAKFPDFGKHVSIETSAKGPIVCIRHDSTIEPKDSCYRWGQELQAQEMKADLKLFLSLLKNTY